MDNDDRDAAQKDRAGGQFLRGRSDVFVGRRTSIDRYLVASTSGFFPVLVRTADTGLAVVFRSEAAHMGITGTLSLSRSSDGGRSFSDPQRLAPRWEDTRNPALGVTKSGRLILAYWLGARHAYKEDEWGWVWEKKPSEEIKSTPALAIRLSDDGGKTWSDPYLHLSELFVSASPYGRIIESADGSLLLSFYGRMRGRPEETIGCGIMRSRDDGLTWGEERLIAEAYNETALLELPDGRLLAASRSQSERNIATFESEDRGDSFRFIDDVTRRNEHPADLTLLQSGRVLLTFGRRIRPFGCGGLVSEDGGRSWDRSHEALLAGDGARNTDLGYPSTVQLADGTIVTALYYASGSQMSDDGLRSWGEVSCQVLHYDESLFA